ncbi:MAG: sensor histidine kinase [Acetanaerobacterium sp.]
MAIYIVSGIALICCVLTVIFSRRYVRTAYNSIDKVLDRVLAKETSLPLSTTRDDRISKLMHKANRIVEMCVSDVAQTREEKETIQGFISDMSHQMKTPLSSISMYSDLLMEGRLSEEERQEFVIRIKSGTEKLQWMMDSLIKMSRLEVGAIQLTPVGAGIRQTISEGISGVVAVAAKKNISITVSSFDDAVLIHDRKWTREALNNILENAVKYSPADGSVEVSIEQLSLYTKITITDHGIGIDKADFNQIFKRFYRGENTKNSEGAGLGLYLAMLIMEKQGGYIMVDSKPFEFTSFSLFLQNCKK